MFTSKNQVFASFIVEQLPTGVVGLTLAAVFSAAMSTLSSSLNASALIGFAAGICTLTYIAFLAPDDLKINGFYYSFVGSMTTFAVGWLGAYRSERTARH